MMTKEQRKAKREAEAKAVTILQEKLSPFIPQGWYSTECMALDLSDLSAETPVMVCICPKEETVMPIGKGLSISERTKARRTVFYPVAEQLLATIKANGFRTYKDGWTVYIKS